MNDASAALGFCGPSPVAWDMAWDMAWVVACDMAWVVA